MELFPTFLRLTGRPVLVVGGGPVAASKLAALRAAGADVRVVAPDVCPAVAAAGVRVDRKPFDESDLEGVWFVVAAATREVNARVARGAEERRVFVNAVDDPPNASAYLGGIVRRSGVTVAISTDGEAPALAGLLREGLDAMLPADLDRWMDTARSIRRTWKSNGTPMQERRPQLLDALIGLYSTPAAGDDEQPEPARNASPSQRTWESPGTPRERSEQR